MERRPPASPPVPEERAWRAAAAAVRRTAAEWESAPPDDRAEPFARHVRALAVEEQAAAAFERRTRATSRLVGL